MLSEPSYFYFFLDPFYDIIIEENLNLNSWSITVDSKSKSFGKQILLHLEIIVRQQNTV